MLALANAYAAAEGVTDRCRFVRSDFDDFTDDRPFDVTIAIGFFDYIADPLKTLRHMRELTRGRVMASFPKPQLVRSQLRTRRYAARGVHIRYYRRAEIEALEEKLKTIPADAIPGGTSCADRFSMKGSASLEIWLTQKEGSGDWVCQ